MEINQLIDWGFTGLVSFGLMHGVKILSNIQKSIDRLNLSVAQVIERTAAHEKELDRHEARLERLEAKKR